MAEKKQPKWEIEEELSVLKESDKSDWTLEINRVSWNGKPAKLEIRHIKRGTTKDNTIMGAGIGLQDEIWNDVVEELIRLGYGNITTIKKNLKNR